MLANATPNTSAEHAVILIKITLYCVARDTDTIIIFRLQLIIKILIVTVTVTSLHHSPLSRARPELAGTSWE